MLPHIHILGLSLPSYSLMLVLGFAAFFGLYLYFFRAELRSDRVSFNRLTLAVILSIATLAFSAYLFDGIFHSIEKGELSFGGITWLGGVLGGFPAILLLTHLLVPKKRGYALDALDCLIPGLAIAHGFGRLGCFLGGCCFGGVTDSPLGVVFPEGSVAAELYPNPAAEGSLPVLPTQLFEAGFELLLFTALILLSRKTKKYNTAVWSISYATFRFLLEFMRGDDRGSTALGISPSQLMSIALLLFGVGVVLMRLGIAPRRVKARLECWRSEADALPVTPYGAVKCADALRELHRLYEDGLISEEEYTEKKHEILERF